MSRLVNLLFQGSFLQVSGLSQKPEGKATGTLVASAVETAAVVAADTTRLGKRVTVVWLKLEHDRNQLKELKTTCDFLVSQVGWWLRWLI